MPVIDAPGNDTEGLRGRLKLLLFFRVLIVSFFLGALALLYLGTGEQRYSVSVSWLLFSIIFTYALTILSAVFLLRLKHLRIFTCLQVGLDVCLTTGVILMTGGSDSPFGFLYGLVVINAAALLSTPGAILAAASSSVAYGLLIVVLHTGILPRPEYPFPPEPFDRQFALRFATTNGTFFLMAALASSLVRRLHEAERLVGERETERDRLASLQEALARNIGSALITTDADGCVTSMNHTAEEVAGFRAAEVIGKDVGDIFTPMRHTGLGRLQFLQSSSSVRPTEFMHRTADGRLLTLRCSAVAVRDTYENPIGALFILQDITKLRYLEERLQQTAPGPADHESALEEEPAVNGLVGTSPAMAHIHQLIEKAARTDATLLISGEKGTGKEFVARAVHARSARCDRPFVAVNCGAIRSDLIESELFGHAKGAYPGAATRTPGLFRIADGGTIFLDEVDDLPTSIQAKLLRVLQERSFTPIGADTHVTVDVRVIAATSHELIEAVQAARLREDLFYRLNVLTITVPPLRERRQDIPLMVRRFLHQFSKLHNKTLVRLSVSTSRRLQEYAYPGNVRELENIIEHAVVLCDGETIHDDHLPGSVRGQHDTPAGALPLEALAPPPLIIQPPGADNLDDSLASYEKRVLLKALADAGGVKKRAAELLGINYRSFRHRLQKYGIGELNH
jgi:two-component system response regulator PilR (NtrC family)